MGRKTLHKLAEQGRKLAGFELCLKDRSAQLKSSKGEREREAVEKALAGVAAYAQYAERPLSAFAPAGKTSRPEKIALEAARFCFCKFKPAPILARAWTHNDKMPSGIDAKLWYAKVASGQSFLKECAKGMLTRKEAHAFLTCKHDIGLAQALHFAVAKQAGASDGIALRIARSKISEMPFDDYWRSNARFFAANPPESVEQASDIVDYLRHKRAENANFTILGQGLNIQSLHKRVVDWHRDLSRIKAMGQGSWPGAPLPDWQTESSDRSGQPALWKFEQIKTAPELAKEGNAMHHCVFSYKSQCMQGAVSIWSLKAAPLYSGIPGSFERKLTIELGSDMSIRQARGLANRLPRNDEANAVYQWAKAMGLSHPSRGLNARW